MVHYSRMFRWFFALFLCIPVVSIAATPITSVVFFGDSMSDTGNTTRLLKSLRQEEDPAFFVEPFKMFVLNKMVDYANEYYVPQMVLDSGIAIVNDFFDNELAPYVAALISHIKTVPILPGAPYWNGHFSNGRVWNEYLAHMLDVSSADKEMFFNDAFGGSWSTTYDYQLTVWNLIRHPLKSVKNLIMGKLIPPSLGLTVQAYLMQHQKISDDTVFFIFSGNNDYVNMLNFEKNYNVVMSSYVDNVLSSIDYAITKLMHAGARRFVIMGIPHLGNTPRLINTSERYVLNTAIDTHNERLQRYIIEWNKLYPNADLFYVDMGEYFEHVLKEADSYGFTNTEQACIDVRLPLHQELADSPFADNFVLRYAQGLQHQDKHFSADYKNYHVCSNPDSYLFWDDIHPSTRAHELLANELCKAMVRHGYAATCPNP